MTAPDLASFTEITRRVVSRDGMEGYLPTVLIGKEVRVIEGIPASVDQRDAIQEHVSKAGLLGSTFFFGVRSGADEVTTGHFRPGHVACMCVVRSDAGFRVLDEADASWWRVGL
jgi:hypothetical protein